MPAGLKSFLVLAASLAVSVSPAAALPRHHLPAGYHWGRCQLIVDGKRRISGKCAYQIYAGGEFHIDGPRQIYDGIDYPKAEIMAAMRSTDYWADVFKDEHGQWTGYGNENIASVHGEGDWGVLRREGACYVGKSVRVCLWQK